MLVQYNMLVRKDDQWALYSWLVPSSLDLVLWWTFRICVGFYISSESVPHLNNYANISNGYNFKYKHRFKYKAVQKNKKKTG